MARRLMNHWPSILLVIALVIGIVTCFGHLDNLVIDEVRALISVLFGFATTCLLLSYIWLIQRKPINRSWQHQTFPIGIDVIPSMHPRGRLDSLDSIFENSMTVRTISNPELERPPAYEDALINSKPINWEQSSGLLVGKQTFKSSQRSIRDGCNCHHTIVELIAHDLEQQSRVCDACRVRSSNIKTIFSDKRDLATANEPQANNSQHQPTFCSRFTQQEFHPDHHIASNEWKVSYAQLDVTQLILCSSPPKYCHQMTENYLNELNSIHK